MMIETLRAVVIKRPENGIFEDFRDWGELFDSELLSDLYNNYSVKKVAFYAKYQKKNKRPDPGAGEAGHSSSPLHDEPIPGTAGKPKSQRSVPVPDGVPDQSGGDLRTRPRDGGQPSEGYPKSENVRVVESNNSST